MSSSRDPRDARTRNAGGRDAHHRESAAPRDGDRKSSIPRSTPLKTNILVADDHPIVLKGLRTVLNAQPDLVVVAEATDGAQAVERALNEDVQLVILEHPDAAHDSGLQAAREITQRKPEVRVLILSMHHNEQFLFEAIRAGRFWLRVEELGPSRSRGGVPRDDARAAYPRRRRRAGADARVLRTRSLRRDGDHGELLTPREVEVVKLVAEAHTNEEIGSPPAHLQEDGRAASREHPREAGHARPRPARRATRPAWLIKPGPISGRAGPPRP